MDPRHIDIVRRLDDVVGNTSVSLISMVLPPRSKIASSLRMLQTELDIVENMRSESKKRAASRAIRETQDLLNTVYIFPENGLFVFVGTDVNGHLHRECFEPNVPINTSLYLIDRTFHTHVFHTM